MLTTQNLYDLSHSLAGEYLAGFAYPWQALEGIRDLILSLGSRLGADYVESAPSVWIHRTAKVAPTAYLGAPCIIGADTEVRHCAFIRESALVGDGILGYKSHMGAGAVTSNIKADESLITIRNGSERIDTGMQKIGALVGDHVEVGCNTVLNPGTVVGRNTNIYPLSFVRGVVPENSILKTGGVLAAKELNHR